jgi:molybdenum cofactor cytidylyltransferase
VAKGTAHVEAGPSVAAIVLAAGRATRMGSQKVLLELGGRSLVQRVVDAALGSRVAETIVVVGHEAEAVRGQLAERAVTVVENREYAQGMSTSLRAGVRAAGGCDGAIVLLGDQPFVTSDLLDRLIEAFAETGSVVVRPVVATRPANPVLLGSVLFPEVMEQRGDVGGRGIVERHAADVALVALDDGAVIMDIDSPDDYARARVST